MTSTSNENRADVREVRPRVKTKLAAVGMSVCCLPSHRRCFSVARPRADTRPVHAESCLGLWPQAIFLHQKQCVRWGKRSAGIWRVSR